MIPSLTPLQVVQRAFTEIVQSPVLLSGTLGTNFGGSPNGIYAATLYQGAVQLLLRQQDWEFSRRVVTLATTGNPAPYPWPYEYIYPADCIKVRQVQPATWDLTDPQPIRWEVGFDATGTETVIWSSVAGATLTYTTNAVTEGNWSDDFTEQMVRYLGSQLAMPTAGRPDFSREMLDVAGRVGGGAEGRDS